MYYGEIKTAYRIIENNFDISKARTNIRTDVNYYYDGKEIEITPEDVIVSIGDKTVPYTGYKIVEGTYENNIKAGTARVMIEGIGEYGGSKQVSFKIKAFKAE